jgi:hypothetical protein
MGTNCAPLLADLFLYSYESEFLQKLVKDKRIHEARAFNFTYRYIDDVLSMLKQCPSKGDKYVIDEDLQHTDHLFLGVACFTFLNIDDVLSINNSRFAEFLPLIYLPELEVKETTDTASFASFLDLYLEFDDRKKFCKSRIIDR